MRRSAIPLALLLAVAVPRAAPASADPGDWGPFRRTTPRADVIGSGDWTLLGIPGGRAWGLESGLRGLDGVRAVSVELAVIDPAVREAFLRIAYYARAEGRPRQITTDDSEPVSLSAGPAGTTARVWLEPPPGAVAYRIRLLGRLFGREQRTWAGAIRARLAPLAASVGGRPSLTRLLIEPP